MEPLGESPDQDQSDPWAFPSRWVDPESITAGSLLLASTDLHEPTFRRSVVFLIEHNDTGSLGVVINRMSQTAVHNVLPQWTDLAAQPKAIYLGGPVKQDAALCLGVLQSGVAASDVAAFRPVTDDVVLVDLDTDPELAAMALSSVRIFAGYAGWGVGQLADEVAQEAWLVVPGGAADLRAPATADLWAEVLRRQPWPYPVLATHPIDVDRN